MGPAWFAMPSSAIDKPGRAIDPRALPARPATGEPSRASAAGRARQSSRSLTAEPFQASNTDRHVIGAACAAVPGVTATAAAHAQSSVALHGLLDASIAYTNTQSGKHAWQQGRGLPSNTVFGLSGSDGPGARLRVAPRAGRIVDAYASRGDDRHPASVPTARRERHRASGARTTRELGVPPPRAKAHWRARPVVECAPPLPG
ncbi:hypothetical protein [Burkholderia pseudomallei]|uniref:hypothetical protein n=1 Tax=Burkholderia pseudomallei TaxID=28450 RepID=UPI001E53CA1F|nr:hypothetical protein [Burkholderia pseudomallei]